MARNRLRPLLHSLAPVKDRQLGFAKLPLFVERSLASRADRRLRPSRFGASTQLGRNGPVPSARSRDRAKGPSGQRLTLRPSFFGGGAGTALPSRSDIQGIHRCGARGLRASAQSGDLVALLSFRPVVSHVRTRVIPLGLRPAPPAGCGSRPSPVASLPSITALPGIDIIHFAHRSGTAEILINSGGGLWSIAVSAVVKCSKSKGSAQPRLCSGRL